MPCVTVLAHIIITLLSNPNPNPIPNPNPNPYPILILSLIPNLPPCTLRSLVQDAGVAVQLSIGAVVASQERSMEQGSMDQAGFMKMIAYHAIYPGNNKKMFLFFVSVGKLNSLNTLPHPEILTAEDALAIFEVTTISKGFRTKLSAHFHVALMFPSSSFLAPPTPGAEKSGGLFFFW